MISDGPKPQTADPLSTQVSFSGQFWLAAEPQTRSSGVVSISETGGCEAHLTAELYPAFDLNVVNLRPDGLTTSDIVPTDRGPQLIHGLVDLDGEEPTPISLVSATSVGWDGQGQTFRALWALAGAHVNEHSQFDGIRVAFLDFPAGSMGSSSINGGGRVQLADEWIIIQGIEPSTYRELGRSVVRPLATLLAMARGGRVPPQRMQVVCADGTWRALFARVHGTGSTPEDPLLPNSELTTDVLAEWLRRANDLGPLSGAFASVLENELHIEAQALILTTVAEGIHRVLYPETARFSRAHGARVREAAVQAARDVDPDEDTAKAVDGFLRHIHEAGYGRRLEELGATAAGIVPEVIGTPNKWKKLVYDVRNRYAHQSSTEWMEEDHLDRVLTAAQSLSWVLRLVLLSQAGIPSDRLQRLFRENERFRCFLKNVAAWQPSVYGNTLSAQANSGAGGGS